MPPRPLVTRQIVIGTLDPIQGDGEGIDQRQRGRGWMLTGGRLQMFGQARESVEMKRLSSKAFVPHHATSCDSSFTAASGSGNKDSTRRPSASANRAKVSYAALLFGLRSSWEIVLWPTPERAASCICVNRAR
jgi:hypothetical protein